MRLEGKPRAAEFNPAYLLQLPRAREGEEAVWAELGCPGEAAVFAAAGYYRHVLRTLRPASPAAEAVVASGNGAVGGAIPERVPHADEEYPDPQDGLGSR
jgi:hypothetical protein